MGTMRQRTIHLIASTVAFGIVCAGTSQAQDVASITKEQAGELLKAAVQIETLDRVLSLCQAIAPDYATANEAIMDAYIDFRFSLKEAESLAHELQAQQVEHRVAVLAAGKAHHDPVTRLDHPEVGDRLADLAAETGLDLAGGGRRFSDSDGRGDTPLRKLARDAADLVTLDAHIRQEPVIEPSQLAGGDPCPPPRDVAAPGPAEEPARPPRQGRTLGRQSVRLHGLGHVARNVLPRQPDVFQKMVVERLELTDPGSPPLRGEERLVGRCREARGGPSEGAPGHVRMAPRMGHVVRARGRTRGTRR